MNKPVFFIPLIATILFFILYFIFASSGGLLSVEPGYAIGEVSRWCERISGGFFREPVNALSNLGFITTGLIMFWILANESTKKGMPFHGTNVIALVYAGAAVFLGPGSLLMHGTHTHWGGWADILSMTMFICIPWLVNIFSAKRWSDQHFFKTYLVTISVYGILSWFFGTDFGINFNLWALSIALWLITEVILAFYSTTTRLFSGFVGIAAMAAFGIFPEEIAENFEAYWWIILFWAPAIMINSKPNLSKKYFPWFWLGIFFYMSAFAIWLQGYPNTALCNPDSLFQPHGAWHLLSSLATLSFFFFFRTLRLK